jgi:hypothetical protein
MCRILCECSQPFGELLTDRLHRREDPVGKVFLPEFVPYVFLWIELRRVGRERDEVDVLGYLKCLGFMGAGSIHYHEDEFVRIFLADLQEEATHFFGVHFFAGAIVEVAFERTDRSVNVGELALVTVAHHRATFCGCPATAGA